MDGGSGNHSSSAVDRTRVLDVKPLRSLVPVFSSNPQTPSFVNTPPSGPYPPGFSPFYPFSGPRNAQPPPDLNRGTAHTPTPLRSFRASKSNGNVVVDLDEDDEEDDGSYEFQRRSSSARSRKLRNSSAYYQKKARMESTAVNEKFVLGLSPEEREDGNREVVVSVLMRFDALKRRLSQLDDSKEASSGTIRRPDLMASNLLMSKGVRTNMRKRIGSVPGVEIGDIYFFRMELCLVGLHAPSMGGIDYMVVRANGEELPLAVSIVSSGGYDDDAEDTNMLVYTGQGGNANKKGERAADQKLERGNLALERSSRKLNEIRVIRGVRDFANPTGKVYVYDGLYRIQESWMERGKSGSNIFKHKLLRIPGQPEAYALWKSIESCKDGLSSRVGLILPDLTSGGESIPVSLVNDVDEEKGPDCFTYFPAIKFSKSFKLIEPSFGCSCSNACKPGNLDCSCIRKNGGDFPYTTNGVLVSRKPLVYECGNTCPCIPNCKNRVSQSGLKVHLEVFKTKDRGWGLRSLDPIRSGTFICEYAGEVIDRDTLGENREEGEYDDYLFDTSRVYHPFKWNCEAGLIEEDGSDDNAVEYNIPYPIIINAMNAGNVARFMNHSCYPNTFWQPVIYENNNDVFIHIAFYAIRHIPPMTELTYDYGTSRLNNGNNGHQGKKKCLCGSPRCCGYFG